MLLTALYPNSPTRFKSKPSSLYLRVKKKDVFKGIFKITPYHYYVGYLKGPLNITLAKFSWENNNWNLITSNKNLTGRGNAIKESNINIKSIHQLFAFLWGKPQLDYFEWEGKTIQLQYQYHKGSKKPYLIHFYQHNLKLGEILILNHNSIIPST